MVANLRDVSIPKAPSRDAQGRPLPNDADAERKVLACVLWNGDVAPIRDLLTVHDFLAPMHGELWTAMVDLDARGTDPAHHNVVAQLRAAGRLQPEMVDLLIGLQQLEDGARRSLVDLARRLAVLGLRRRALGELWHAHAHGYVDLTDDRAWLEQIAAAMIRIVAELKDVRAFGLAEAHEHALATVAAAHGEGSPEDRGIPTGFAELDSVFSLRRGQMTLLSGPTGRGKSAFALNVALNVAKAGHGVLYLQLEDSAGALAMRAACVAGAIDSARLNQGIASIEERVRFEQARDWMKKTPLHIVDDPEIDAVGVTGAVARGRMWTYERRAPLALVIVDYLQLVNGRKLVRERDSREQEVSAVARALSKLAVRERVAVLALCQLNDDGAIRESRAALQHAANWLDLQRTSRRETPHGEPEPIMLKIKKQRHGRCPGSVPFWFVRQFSRFTEGS